MFNEYLIQAKGLQLSLGELNLIFDLVKKLSPCKILVWGLGADTDLWLHYNKGKTVFLEHDTRWINKLNRERTGVDIRQIEYTTKAEDYLEIFNNQILLRLELPSDITETSWDIIFVDAPTGNGHGRMQSIYMTSQLKLRHCNCNVFVHDCERKIERKYCDKYLGEKYKKERKLRWYK